MKNNPQHAPSTPAIKPYKLQVPESALAELRLRLELTRWPQAGGASDWNYGVSVPYAKELAAYWKNGYDWRAQEERLNRNPQFVTEIDGAAIHFIHVRSPEPDALPLLLLHGWPSSVMEFNDLIGPLSDPKAYGGDPADAFHLVIPSLPGFGLSGATEEAWPVSRIAAAMQELMSRLGYEQYGSHGSDLGAMVSRELGVMQPPELLGIHVLQLFSFPSGDPGEMAKLTEADGQRLAFLSLFAERAGFSAIMEKRPLTLSYGLADSPIGQMCWIADLFCGFGDHVDFIGRDAFLTNVMLYWLTNTAASSSRIYYDNNKMSQAIGFKRNETPTGVAVCAHDFKSIRLFADRDNSNIVHWSELSEGTHFAALDAPGPLAQDIRSMFRRFR
ncbi:epoxide hydrolase [Paenibacillus pasadenensis]|uniref:epoxide hydrolase family protein n=1 Tax=Paenibacillus pasadenensis TaxID=217090 RepID=UPI00203DFAA1|nr:epoxide hydrolase family protein [Paenibacillus pasadenensis]MCM3749595.1 epoxide hydrolase [Paenibacillus pasadenensis]